jgi:hypothetical protein
MERQSRKQTLLCTWEVNLCLIIFVVRLWYKVQTRLIYLPASYHFPQSSSSFLLAPPTPPLPLPPPLPRIAAVPIALGLGSSGFPKLSQKSVLVSSRGFLRPPVAGPSALPSTKRLNPSAAPFAPVCAVFATWAAASRAWAAMSASAIYTPCQCSNSLGH